MFDSSGRSARRRFTSITMMPQLPDSFTRHLSHFASMLPLAVAATIAITVMAGSSSAPAATAGSEHASHAHAAAAAPATTTPWRSGVPAEGSSVTIPAGHTVVLDRSVSLANLTIRGRLVFARRNLVLETDWIHVVGGTLQVGTRSAPFLQRATIRLRDRTPGERHGHLGDKFIGLTGGRLELHGRPRRGWTRLVRTAHAGQLRLVLQDARGWRAGDRIAIASTDYDPGQAEERTIRTVHGNVVTLDEQLQYTHNGVRERVAGRWLDERAEVALLSRNVRIEGDAASERTRFGGQVMAMHGASLRIANVEFTRMGQEGLLLRYPIHFHMLGNAGAGSYVRQTSIHHTWNRCLTIHGTNAVRATGNVCFDHVGHGYFLEDGAERRNVLDGNLGFLTRRARDGKAILQSDRSPGTFWITNPDNTVRNNVAAGSDGHGIWIALPEHPTGLFAQLKPGQTRAMWPRRMRLRAFSGNVAHSNDRDGLHFDSGPRPDSSIEATWHEALASPADRESRSLETTMSGLVAWRNRGNGAWLRGRNHQLVRSVIADNAIGVTFASEDSYLRDSLVVGESGNRGTVESWERERGQFGRDGRSLPRPWQSDYPVRGFEFYDGRVGVERTTFANFRPYRSRDGERREQSALGVLVDDDFSLHARSFARALRFVNARRVYLEPPEVGHDGDVSAIFLDADGSVSGRRGASIMTRNPFLYGAGCRLRAEFNAMECMGDYASLIVGAPGDRGAVRPVRVTRSDGAVQTLMASGGGDQAVTTIIANQTYRVTFNGERPERMRFVLYNGRDRWVKVQVPVGAASGGWRVMRYGCDAGQLRAWCSGARSSMAALDASDRTGYHHDPASGLLTLKLVATDTDWDELVVE